MSDAESDEPAKSLGKLSNDALADFIAKSIALKQAESAFKSAQLAYTEAVKRLSEEAVK